tara:strand:- start:188 stop:2305 length:2118 start_codon:yes stop_codon:yes gene_type:complete
MIKNMEPEELYINRELSWINFNERVLEIALDPRTPLLEQVRFSSIFSNNLDEFFMVRVASLKSQVEAGISKKSIDNKSPREQLENIRSRLIPILAKQQKEFTETIKQKLDSENIYLLNYKELNTHQLEWVDNYFRTAIFPVLTPLAVDPAHPFPFVSNLSLNLAALIVDPENNHREFARIKIPKKSLPRFLTIPTELHQSHWNFIHTAIPIEQVVANNLNMLFPGMKIEKYSFFRVTRDADLELRDLEADDLMIAIEEGLRKRRMGGEVVRLEVSEDMPQTILELLQDGMNVKDEDLYRTRGLLGSDELIELTKIDFPRLKYNIHQGVTHKALKSSQLGLLEDGSIKQEEFKSIFSIIRCEDLLLHHPFELFSTSIEEFINQAADDPRVMGIKMTLYRVSKDSAIISALIKAAENGKQVLALVELKARFDEDNNIQWAKRLEQSGVHVVYGVVGLKTHTKIALVVRKEKDRLRTYFHIGTGNYNSRTSQIYTDLGILSCQPELGQDLIELFNYLTGFSKQQKFRKLLVAPVSLRKGIEGLIKREIENAQNNKEAHIRAKMNSLVDPSIINLLYKASQAGVKIELIVRGMCCLYPQKKGLSENIKVTSIIGRFLEHSRIFWFHNDSNSEIYIGSADWMRRNLDRRVEAVTPIENKKLKHQLEKLLEIYLNVKGNSWLMQNNGQFKRIQSDKKEMITQEDLIEIFKQ